MQGREPNTYPVIFGGERTPHTASRRRSGDRAGYEMGSGAPATAAEPPAEWWRSVRGGPVGRTAVPKILSGAVCGTMTAWLFGGSSTTGSRRFGALSLQTAQVAPGGIR